MNGKIYEEATWYDIERNKMHLKKDGEKYVADAMLFRDNLNLRQENESLKKENDRLRELCEDMNKVAHMLCEAWEGSCSKEAEGMSLHAVCPIGDTSELCVFGKLHDRMRELGIGDSND